METEDWNLIRDWQAGSQEAFTQLVRKHLPLVHAAARRQLPAAHLADDVAQAVFLLLARKASSLPPSTVLSGWLFNATRLVVRHTLRSEARRTQREQHALAMDPNPSSAPDASWDRVGAVLDEALAQLAASDRDALLLRFGEGRNHREVGAVLGIGEEAARKRVDRALERLRSRLALAGVAVGTAALGGLLDGRLSAAVPPTLAEQIARTAAAGPGAHPVVEAVLSAERQARRLQWAGVAAGLVLCVTGVVAWKGWSGGATQDTPATAAMTAVSSGASVASGGAGAEGAGGGVPFRTNAVPFLLRVVSGAESRPVPEARVFAHVVMGANWIRLPDLRADAAGFCSVPIPADDLLRLDVAADAPGLGTRTFVWNQSFGTPRPANHILRLQPGVNVGGVVLGSDGAPLAGAEVVVAYNNSDAQWHDPERVSERPGFVRTVPAGTTDAAGRWTFPSIPGDCGRVRVEFLHPDHAPGEIQVGLEDPADAITWSALRAFRLTHRLEAGHVLAGRVVDGEGRAVAGARIAVRDYLTNGVSGPDGMFELRSLRASENRVTVWAPGHAVSSHRLELDRPGQRVVLGRGGRVRVRVVDSGGAPVRGAHVHLNDAGVDPEVNWSWATDREGRMEWDTAPESGAHRFHVGAPGFVSLQDVRLVVSEDEHVVRLEPSSVVEFRVTDAVSGQPVPGFRAIPGTIQSDGDVTLVPYRFDLSESRRAQDGVLRMEAEHAFNAVFQVEASGYVPAIVRPVPSGAGGESRVECQLKRVTEADRIRGRVVDAGGRPVAQASVGLTTYSVDVSVGRGRLDGLYPGLMTRTDAEGRFELEPQPDPVWLVAAGPSGYARTRIGGGGQHELRLAPAGRIEGRCVDEAGRAVAGRTVTLDVPVAYPGVPWLLREDFVTRSGADGAFAFESVPPGTWNLRSYPTELAGSVATSDRLPVGFCVDVTPGARIAGLELGRVPEGWVKATGRLVAPTGLEISDWRPLINYAGLKAVAPDRASSGKELPIDRRRAAWVDWCESEEGIAAACAVREYPLRVGADGRFVSDPVPPGEYRLEGIVIGGGGQLKGFGELDRRPWSASIQTNVVVGVGGSELGELRVGIRR